MAVREEDAPVITMEEREYIASQLKLVWWRFLRHRLAVIATAVILGFYLVSLFPEFLAVHDPQSQDALRTFVPPQQVHFFDGLKPSVPYVYGFIRERDPVTRKPGYSTDDSKKFPIQFFVRGYEYKFVSLFRTDIHLMGVDTDEKTMPFHILGTDRLGRDLYSRLLYGTRVSMSIGLVGVAISLFLGVLLGGISGYRGGLADMIIQRFIEFIRSIPTIPLWLGLAAAVPKEWSVLRLYFAITIIISLLGWTTLAREVRGRFLALKSEDFVIAAHLYGTSELRIVFRHMLPSFISHIIATTTLAVPAIIIAETALSFLGLGLRPPAISWGTLLFEAQNLNAISNAPWLLIPGPFVLLAILAFNFMGDGLRDAADPYSTG
jgi:peptide/nickel transport system permease protein